MENIFREDGYYNDEINNSPVYNKYFYNFCMDNVINIYKEDADVAGIMSATSNIILKKLQMCTMPLDIKDAQGMRKGYVLKLDLNVEVQVKYVGGNDNMSIFVETANFFKRLYIPVPYYMNKDKIADIYRKNKLYSQTYVEDLQVSEFDRRSIKFSLLAIAIIFFRTGNNSIE